MLIRSFELHNDLPALISLWQAALGSHWPLLDRSPETTLRRVALLETDSPCDHFIAEEDGQAVGFVLTQMRGLATDRGGIQALGVLPEYRRRGIGRALLNAACQRLRERGARTIHLGSGGQLYFWPGVPASLPGAWDFFQACGFAEIERSYDMARSLRDYTTPEYVFERLQEKGIGLRHAAAGEAEMVCAWMDTRHPDWTRYFRRAFTERRPGDVVMAHHPGGPLLGVCLAQGMTLAWGHLLSPGQQPDSSRVGALGAVFVDEAAREQGIGLALAAFASQDLRERGYATAFLGWTWLIDWYRRLGYSVWQEYVMSAREG